MRFRSHLLIALLLAATAGAARADSSTRSYAIVVGSNPGGAGQSTLRFAERDAENIATVLRDLGGYQAENVTLLRRPSPAELLAAIDRVGARIRSDAAGGRQSVLFFYYSGHARATALNLGSRELPLEQVREKLLGLPATLKIVVLDACQSGAFSKVKGIEPAADFSYNSIARLDAAGLAVMASSSATELSQESDKLGGSYFTHYLMVALRGAGDSDGDGQVSLSEAYRYAYDRTLVATAKTAVGRQHVTLETDLKGKGEVPLTFPRRANAHLDLGRDLSAEVIVQTRGSGAVVAEVHKAPGPMKLAMAAGAYRVLVVTAGKARQCDVDVAPGRVTPLVLDRCKQVTLADDTTKGGGYLGPRWSIEAGLGGPLATVDDRYLSRLNDFGYEQSFHIPLTYSLSGVYRLSRHLAVTGNIAGLDSDEYLRDDDTESTRFGYASHAFGLLVRGEYPLGAGGVLVPFAEAGAGLVRASNEVKVGERPATREAHWGYHLTAAAGARLQPWQRLGFFARASVAHAPAMDNLLGDTHDSGGAFLTTGLTTSF